ncbi:11709_t:CDS:2, partial [Dentiscutata erythropus]
NGMDMLKTISYLLISMLLRTGDRVKCAEITEERLSGCFFTPKKRLYLNFIKDTQLNVLKLENVGPAIPFIVRC